MMFLRSVRRALRLRVGVAVGMAVALLGALVFALPASAADAPGHPTGLGATASSSFSVTLSWDAPADSDVAGYQILRRRLGSERRPVVHVTDTASTATTWSEDGLAADVVHVYRVKAINDEGTLSRWSKWVKIEWADAVTAEVKLPGRITQQVTLPEPAEDETPAEPENTATEVTPEPEPENTATQTETEPEPENTATQSESEPEPEPENTATQEQNEQNESTLGTVSGVRAHTHPANTHVLIVWDELPTDTSDIAGFALRYRKLLTRTAANNNTWSTWSYWDNPLSPNNFYFNQNIPRTTFASGTAGDAIYEFQVGSVPHAVVDDPNTMEDETFTPSDDPANNYAWSDGVEWYIVQDITKESGMRCFFGDGQGGSYFMIGWHCKADWYVRSYRQLPPNSAMRIPIGTTENTYMANDQEPPYGPYHQPYCSYWVDPVESVKPGYTKPSLCSPIYTPLLTSSGSWCNDDKSPC